MGAASWKRSAAICALWGAVSCSDNSERNIITERAPFFHAALPYKPEETDRIVRAVHRFADANGMDFLVSRNGIERGDYNVTAAAYQLNLKVLHVQAISPTTDVNAYSRKTPTEADRSKAMRFLCVVQGKCQP